MGDVDRLVSSKPMSNREEVSDSSWGDAGPRRFAPPTSEQLGRTRGAILQWAPYALYTAICVSVLPAVSDGYPTADGVSYISIAEHWAAGRFDLAVNGFWSPLLSLLLVPAALVDAPMFLAGQLLMIATGLVTVSQVKRLMHALHYDTVADDILVIGSTPLIAYPAVSLLTPDLLMGTLLLGYLVTMIDRRDRTPLRRGVVAGIWAGLAFLAKAYALPFVIAHLLITLFVRFIRRGDLRERRTFVTVTVLTLAVAVVPWATLLSAKYGEMTVTTTGSYHVDVTARGSAGNAFGWAGILEPPNEFAITAWEDPSLLPRSTSAGPAPVDSDASDVLVNRIRRAIGSLEVAAIAGGLMGATGLLGTLSMLWWFVSRRPSRPVRDASPDPFVDIVLAVAVYIGGLSLLVIETRYLWAPLLLTVPCASWGLRRIHIRRPGFAVRAASSIVAVGSIFGPAIGMSRVIDKAADQERVLAEFSDVLDDGDRVVTSRSALSMMPGLCLANRCQYWGATRANTGQELDDQLRAADIDIYIAYTDDDGGAGDVTLRSTSTGGTPLTVLDRNEGAR